MKTLIVLMFFFVSAVAQAGTQTKVENGKLFVGTTTWTNTTVDVSREAERYMDAVQQAFGKPNVAVKVGQQKAASTVVDVFHYREGAITNFGVQYDPQKAVVDVVEIGDPVKGEVKFFLFPVFWLVAVVLMALVNLLFVRGYIAVVAIGFAFASVITSSVMALALALAIVALAIGFASALAIALALASASAAIAFVFAIAVNVVIEHKKLLSTIYYLLMVALAGFVYYPIF